MLSRQLEQAFGRIGTRVIVRTDPTGNEVPDLLIRADDDGEYFELTVQRLGRDEIMVLDVNARRRRLLLSIDQAGTKQFVCGVRSNEYFAHGVPMRYRSLCELTSRGRTPPDDRRPTAIPA